METSSKKGLVRRILGVILEPGATFREVESDPKVLPTAGLISAVILALAAVAIPKSVEVAAIAIDRMSAQLSAEQLAAAQSMLSVYTSIGVIGGALVGSLGVWLIVAGLIKLFSIFLGGEAKYGTLVSVAALASVPTVVGGAIRTGLMLALPAGEAMYTQTSLAILLPREEFGSTLYLVLSRIDPFTLWTLVLLSIGTAVVLKGKTVRWGAVIFGLWGCYVALMTVLGRNASQGMIQ